MSDDEVNDLVALYQKTSANLSYVRTYYRDPGLVSYLTTLVSTSGNVIYGTRSRTWRALADFFVITFPAAVWGSRRFMAISAALLLVPAIVFAVWIANSTEARNLAIPPALAQSYVDKEFEEYYASEQASQFASHVYTNNIQVGIMAFASGLLFGIPTIIVLVFNGANVGVAAGLFAHYGELGKFFGLILPHGLIELTSVIIAGGAGLHMGWNLIAPGERSRDTALREEGRRVITIVFGLVASFAIAGVIEGFVTGQPWPTWLRLGIGTIVEVAFVAYLVVLGRRAKAAGYTGALGEMDQKGWAKLPELATR